MRRQRLRVAGQHRLRAIRFRVPSGCSVISSDAGRTSCAAVAHVAAMAHSQAMIRRAGAALCSRRGLPCRVAPPDARPRAGNACVAIPLAEIRQPVGAHALAHRGQRRAGCRSRAPTRASGASHSRTGTDRPIACSGACSGASAISESPKRRAQLIRAGFVPGITQREGITVHVGRAGGEPLQSARGALLAGVHVRRIGEVQQLEAHPAGFGVLIGSAVEEVAAASRRPVPAAASHR